MSQPPLTRHIQALEHALGIALFVRDTHSVRLTEAGSRLDAQAQRFLTQLSQGIDSIKMPTTHPRMGITRILNIYALAAFRSLTHSDQPMPATVWHHLGSAPLVDALQHHLLDLVIVAEPNHNPKLNIVNVHTEAMFMALPQAYGHLYPHYFDFDVPNDLPLFWFPRRHSNAYHDKCHAFLTRLPQPPTRRPEPEDSLIMLAQVAQGLGMALITESMSGLMQQGLCYRPFHPKYQGLFNLDVCLALRADEEDAKVLSLAAEYQVAFAAHRLRSEAGIATHHGGPYTETG